MPRLAWIYRTSALWFNRYIWQFHTGKAGTFSILLVLYLDTYSRIEIFLKSAKAMLAPTASIIVNSGWFHLGLGVIGFTLLYRSTLEGKKHAPPQTTDERLDALEQGIQKVCDIKRQLATTNATAGIIEHRTGLLEIGVRALPRFIRDWVDFTLLLDDVDTAILGFIRMQSIYGLSPVVATPFSGWRPTNQTLESVPNDILDGEKWARSLEEHVLNLNSFYLGHRMSPPALSTGVLFTLINSWIVNRNDIPGTRMLELLREHRNDLVKLRSDYAATLVAGALDKATISAIDHA